jgi:hypothetical protein
MNGRLLGIVLGFGIAINFGTNGAFESVEAQPSPIIENVVETGNADVIDFEPGFGGCAFVRQVGRGGLVFYSDFSDGKSPINPTMKIRGKARRLKLVSGVNERKDSPLRPQVGDRSTYVYKSGKITVKLYLIVTGFASTSIDDNNKVNNDKGTTNYDAKITVWIGDRRETVSAQGICVPRMTP